MTRPALRGDPTPEQVRAGFLTGLVLGCVAGLVAGVVVAGQARRFGGTQ